LVARLDVVVRASEGAGVAGLVRRLVTELL
jgi:hypothetical protein